MTCELYDVVVVPFPFTDRRANKRRPALALCAGEFSSASGHTVMAMITSAKNPDVLIDHVAAGPGAPSKVRMKVFTLDNRLRLRKIGILGARDRDSVTQAVVNMLGFMQQAQING